MVDLRRVLAPEEPRDIEVITGEILDLKQRAGESILGIGQRLIEAKALLPHGEWLPWLTERVEFSERTAQNFMRLSREWSNPQTLADLGASKALVLLALPADERDQFTQENNVVDMTSRELERAIRERNEARMEAETAAANAKAADAARAKMEQDMAALKSLLTAAQTEKDTAEKDMDAIRENLATVEKELAELKAAPVEVAVMAADQTALEDARREAAEAARADMLDELNKAKEARAKAVEKRKAAEQSLASLQERLEAALKAEKKAVLSSDKDMAIFEVLFNQAQDIANKMQGLLIKARGREDQEIAEKLQKALLALSAAIGRAAE